MKKQNIISIVIVMLLTIAAGFIDAYTFLERSGLFAFMQTGNLIKLFIAIANGDIKDYSYKLLLILPIVTFILGCVIATLLGKSKYQSKIVLICLTLSVVGASFIPQTEAWDIICVTILSFTAAMQFEAYRRCLGSVVTTTMCTNNMRLLGNSIAHLKIKNILLYLSIILAFALGVAIGVPVCKEMEMLALIPISGIYLVVLIIEIVTSVTPNNEETIIAD